ncbi:hypothetical protein M0638_12630 [Roseomonas sp. NAR14]|uniref:Uncharacterized protein n=1 Tax=Roseomonas acroporae TaxID=2937791 RepID=A0A9X2BVN6_9PROT|nr:hypothetical protein [Roseomonas acroporae]MCK8785231.1 hypothetical protein [Roseomonas acroporae]
MSETTTADKPKRARDPNAPKKPHAVFGEIETGLPIPSPELARGQVYDWGRLQPGQSVTVQHMSAAGARRSAEIWAKKHAPGAKFEVRKAGENLTRIWRTA